jgi:hydrogenase 3 maturation protease
MKCSDSPGFEPVLRERLAGARHLAVVGIGDELNPHDRLGMLAARRIEALGLPGLKVFYGGTMPESVTAPVRRSRPAHILFIDAAVMGKAPGTLGIIEACEVHADLLITHALPLPVVMEYLEKEAKAQVTLLGIQPDLSVAGELPTREEKAGLVKLTGILKEIYPRTH